MTTDELFNLTCGIEYFISRHKDTGQEYKYQYYWQAKSFCDFYNYDGDHTPEDYEPWGIYAKIKNTPTTLPKKP